MREFNKVNPSLWGSKKFQKLSQQDKLLYLYFLTTPNSSSAGCYRIPVGYIAIDTGMSRDDISQGIKAIVDTGLIRFDLAEEVVYIERWFDFNRPNNPKHCLKVINELKQVPSYELRTVAAKNLLDFIEATTWDKSNVVKHLEPLLKEKKPENRDTVSQKQDTVSRVEHTETKTETETEDDSFNSCHSNLVQEAFFLYNETAQKLCLPEAQKLTVVRASKIKARLKECGGIDGWKYALDKLDRPFLRGKNTSGWRADLDFMLQQKSFTKLIEGSYDYESTNHKQDNLITGFSKAYSE